MSKAARIPKVSGAKLLRFAVWTVVIALAVVVLFTTVFPWVEERSQDPTLGAPLTLPIAAITH